MIFLASAVSYVSSNVGDRMSFSWDFNTATLTLIALQIVGFIVYQVKTNGKAVEALKVAISAQKRADEAHEKIVIQQTALGMLREHIAAEYVDRDSLREMEQRLTAHIDRLADRLDRHSPK